MHINKKNTNKTFKDSITQFLIDTGKITVTVGGDFGVIPFASTAKMAFEYVEEHATNNLIEEVLNGLKDVNVSGLEPYKMVIRLYKTNQVIAKAITNDKIQRFKNLTINGIIFQKELSDNDYETFVELTDRLTDEEFLFLSVLTQRIPQNSYNEYKEFRQMYEKFLEEFMSCYSFDKDKILYIRNSLVGKGLLDFVMTYGGLELGHIVDISYKYVNFVENSNGGTNAK